MSCECALWVASCKLEALPAAVSSPRGGRVQRNRVGKREREVQSGREREGARAEMKKRSRNYEQRSAK